MTIEVGLLIAVIGCLVGLAGWMRNRDKSVASDAEWRGGVNAKLDIIVGIREDVNDIKITIADHGERISKVESSAAQAHHRIDEIRKEHDA